MISYLGDFAEDATVYIMFNTFSSDDPSASCTITNFINTDVHIHKDDGLTQRNNAAGITVSVDFDGITGSHMVKIDTSDNTVAGFWVVGHEYFVRIEGTTIDGATINSVVGQFSIENRYNEVPPTAAAIVNEWETQSQADPTGFHVNVKEVNGTAQTANDNSADINSILGDTNELQTDWTDGGRLDLLLDACALEATVAALNDISVADIIAGVADGSYDLQEMIRIMFAVLSGKSSGGGTTTLKFRDAADSKDRVSETVTSVGNRTAVTRDGS